MSNNVDNRVVRMTFDNAQFEKNIKNTMQTLSKFEEKLKLSDASKGFEAVKSAADKLNFSALGKHADDASKKISNMATEAKNSLDAMQKSLDKADFSGMSSSASKAADAINNALASIDFNELDSKSQQALASMMNEAGKIDFSAITDAAGRVDFSALPDNVAIAIGAVMDKAGDLNFSGIAQNAESVMSDVNSAIEDVDFSSLGVEATDAIGQVNNAAGQTDFSPVSNSAWTASTDTNNAISSIDLYSLVDATDEASRGFQVMETIAIGALLNIGTQIETLVSNLALSGLGKIKDAIVSPIQDGLNEYQTQIGSIQTILANTGRSFHSSADIAEVNSVLDDLNLYADKTIYNFTEMVRNIGMFTAAGTDLYDAADAIKGLANLAALQGADSTSASRAMYQMSQALASGYVKLMDWRSLENAGMGGAIFRDVVLNTAEKKYTQEGEISYLKTIEGIRSGELAFNETLTEDPWISADVLLESLKQLTYAFGDLDDKTKILTQNERAELQQKKKEAEEHLKSLGYRQEEIKAIFELGQKAQESATQVRTFKQLVDTVTEALGSGWAQSWRYILGDFQQTTELMTKISKAITDVIETYDTARNNLLAEWTNWGGWQELWGGVRTIYQEDAEGNILMDSNGDPLILDSYKVVGALDHILESISKPLKAFKDAFADVFGDFFTGEHLYDLTKAFNDFTESLILSESATEGIKGIFEAAFEIIKAVLQIGTHVVQIGGDILAIIREITDPIFDIILSIFGETSEGFAGILDFLLDIENGVFEFIHGGLTTLKDILHTIVGGFFDLLSIPETIGFIGDAIGNLFETITGGTAIGDMLENVAESIGIFVINVLDFLGLVPENIDSTLPLPEIFKKIYDGVKENLSKAMDKIVDSIPGLRDFINVMSSDDNNKKVEYFIGLFDKIKEIVLPVVRVLAAPFVLLKDALVELGTAFVNLEPIQSFIEWIQELIDNVIDWILDLPNKITQTAIDVGQAFSLLLGNVKSDEVTDKANQIVGGIREINVTTPFTLLGGGIALGLKTLITTIKDGLGEVSEFLFGWLDDRPKKFVESLRKFVEDIPKKLTSIEKPLKEFTKLLLPKDMHDDINLWFTNTYTAISTGMSRLSIWIRDTTKDSATVPDALISIIVGGWDELLDAIKNFDPEEAAINLLTKIDEIKTFILTRTGGFLDYIFGFKKERVTGTSGYEMEGFTFSDYFAKIGENISKGIEEAKKKVSELFGNTNEGTIFDKISEFFVGKKDEPEDLESKIQTLSTNLNRETASMVGGVVGTVTDPSTTFDKVSKFMDDHKDDIFKPLELISNWLDNTFFPNTKRVFTTGLSNVKQAITGGLDEITKIVEPIFKDVDSWPEFFSKSLNSIAESIGKSLGSIIAYFSDPEFSLSKMFTDIKNAVIEFVETTREKFPALGDILGGVALILEPILSTISGFFSGLETGASGLYDSTVGVFTDIPGALKTIWDSIISTFDGAWNSFLAGLNEKVPGAKEFIEQVLADLNDMFNIFDGNVSETSEGILSGITDFFDGLGSVANNSEGKDAVEIIKETLDNLWDSFNENKLTIIANSVKTIGEGLLLVNIGRFVGGLKNVVQSISDKISGYEKESFSEKIKDLAEAIAIVTASVWSLSTIPEKDLKRAEDALKLIAGILAGMEILEGTISFIAKKLKLKEFASAKSAAAELAALALAMKVLGGMEQDELIKAGTTILAMKFFIEAMDVIGNSIIASVLSKKGVTLFDPVKSGVKEIIALTLSAVVLALIPETLLQKAISALIIMETVILTFEAICGHIAQTNPASILAVEAVSKAMVRIGLAVVEICFGFSLLKDVDPAVVTVAGIMIGAFMVIVGKIAAKATDITKIGPMLATGGAFAIAAAGMVEICAGFKLLDGMDPVVIGVAGTVIDIFMGIVGVVAAKVSDVTKVGPMLATGGAFAIAAAGVVEICLGFKQLEGMDPNALLGMSGSISIILGVIGLFNTLSGALSVGFLSTLASGGAFALAAAGIIEICYGLKQLEGMDPNTLTGAAGTIDQFLLIIGAFNTLSGMVGSGNPLSFLNILASGGAFWAAAMGVVEICNGLKQLEGMNPDTLVGAAGTIDQFLIIIGSFNTLSGVVGAVNPLASLGILASGGAFWAAAMGVVEICNGLKTLDGMSELSLQPATDAINEILTIVGRINTVSGFSLNAFGILASGGAFWEASMGVVEICNGLKQLDGMDEISLDAASKTIEEIIEIIGKINSSHNIFDSALTLLAGGGAFRMTSEGVVSICISLKELQDFEPISLEGWTTTINEFVGITKKISSETTPIAVTSNVVASDGSLTIAVNGIIYLLKNLEELNNLSAISFDSSKAAVEGTVDIIRTINTATSRFGTIFSAIGKDGAFYAASVGVVDICEVLSTMGEVDSKSIENAKGTISGLTETLESIGKFLSLPIFSNGGTSLSSIAEATESLAEGLERMVEAIQQWLNLTADLPDLLKTAGESLGKLKDDIDKEAKEYPNKVSDWWNDTAEPAIEKLFTNLENELDTAWNKLSSKITKSWDTWWSDAKKWWNDIPDKIIDAIGDTNDIGTHIIDGISEGIRDAMEGYSFNNTLSYIGTYIYNKITSDLQINSPSKLMRDNVGKAIPEGIGAGMIKYSKLMNKPVIKMGRKALESIRGYFDIHSPSRLMRDKIGRYIPEGMAAGIDAYAVVAVDSAEALGASVSQAVYSGLGDISASKYGYGISPVIDMETLKTDIEVLHEMLRIKIDEVTQSLKEFLIEQIELNYEIDDARYAQLSASAQEKLEQIKEYVETEKLTLYGYFEQLNTSLIENIPNMTQQILGAFDTTNQSIASILQAMNSEQSQAVDTAITGTIVQQIGTISESINATSEKLETISAAIGRGSSGKEGSAADIMSNIQYYGDKTIERMTGGFDKTSEVIKQFSESFSTGLFGNKEGGGSEGAGSIWDILKQLSSNTWDESGNAGVGSDVGRILQALTGSSVSSDKSILGAMDDSLQGQTDLSEYLYDSLGGGSGGNSSTMLDSLAYIQDGQIDMNKLFGDAVDKLKETGLSVDDIKQKQGSFSDMLDKIKSSIDANGEKQVYLDSGELVGALLPAIDSGLEGLADMSDRLIGGGKYSVIGNALRSAL